MSILSTDTNIEDKVQEILITKLQNNKSIKDLTENDIKTIKKLFDLFPEMQKKFGKYLENNNKDDQDNDEEIVLEEIIINKNIYYKDSKNGIWDTSANLVGIISNSSEPNENGEQEHDYIFFDKKFKTKIDLENIFL
jgi:hypothetical protein